MDEERARVFRFGETREVVLEGETINEYPASGGQSFALAEMNESLAHYHKKRTEWYFVIGGEGDVIVEGETFHLEALDMLVIPPGKKHNAVRTGDTFRMLVISRPEYSQDDYFRD